MEFQKKVEEFLDEVFIDLYADQELYLTKRHIFKEKLWCEFEKYHQLENCEQKCEDIIFSNGGFADSLKSEISNFKFELFKRNKTRKVQYLLLVSSAIALSSIFIFVTFREFHLLQTVYNNPNPLPVISEIVNYHNNPTSIESILRKSEKSYLYTEDYQYLTSNEPENSYFDLLFLTNNPEAYSDSGYEITNEKVFAQKLDLLENFVSKTKFNPYRLGLFKAIDNDIYPGYARLNLKLLNSIPIRLPYLSHLRNLFKTSAKKVEKLINNAEYDQAENIIILLDKFTATYIQRADFYIELLVIQSLSKNILENQTINTYLKKNFQSIYQRLIYLTEIRSNQNPDPYIENRKLAFNKGSLIAQSLSGYPQTNKVLLQADEFQPSRNLERLQLEKYAFSAVSFGLLLVLIILLLIYSTIFAKMKNKSVVPFYTFKELWIFEAKYFLLPLVLYQIYKILPFASNKYSLNKMGFILIIELSVLFFFLVIFSSWRFMKNSYFKVSMSSPVKKPLRIFTLSNFVFSIFLYCALYFAFLEATNKIFTKSFFYHSILSFPYFNFGSNTSFSQNEGVFIFLTLLSPFYIKFFFFIIECRNIKFKNLPGVLHSYVLHLAFCLIFIGIYSLVYIKTNESRLYKKDNILTVKENSAIHQYEARLIHKIKSEYFKISNEE